MTLAELLQALSDADRPSDILDFEIWKLVTGATGDESHLLMDHSIASGRNHPFSNVSHDFGQGMELLLTSMPRAEIKLHHEAGETYVTVNGDHDDWLVTHGTGKQWPPLRIPRDIPQEDRLRFTPKLASLAMARAAVDIYAKILRINSQ